MGEAIYFANRETGRVVRLDSALAGENFVPLTASEIKEYEAWAKKARTAMQKNKPVPPAPTFGPAKFKEDKERVVAEVLAETVEEPPELEAPSKTDEGGDMSAVFEELFDGENGK